MLETKWDFAYDGDGTRMSTLVTPYDESGLPLTASFTSYYFGGAYETRSDGGIFKYYSFEGQTIVNEYKPATSTWELSYLLSDHLGSIVAVTDGMGTLISQQRYLPFGGERTNLGTISQTDYGYTGQRDLEMGLMDYKARFYSSFLGRFIQPDTITPDGPQGLNRYSYVGNNPIGFKDPSGHLRIGDGEQNSRDGCTNPKYCLNGKPKPAVKPCRSCHTPPATTSTKVATSTTTPLPTFTSTPTPNCIVGPCQPTSTNPVYECQIGPCISGPIITNTPTPTATSIVANPMRTAVSAGGSAYEFLEENCGGVGDTCGADFVDPFIQAMPNSKYPQGLIDFYITAGKIGEQGGQFAYDRGVEMGEGWKTATTFQKIGIVVITVVSVAIVIPGFIPP